MTSYHGTLASRSNHAHPTTATYVAAGVMAIGMACVLTLAELMAPLPLAELAIPPVQTAVAFDSDPSLPAAATVLMGRDTGFEASAPTI